MDLLWMAPFYPVLIGLGYPACLATILGAAKVIAAVVLLAPGLPRLKEWAYAGVVINMVGAAASHVALHQALTNIIAPAMFTGLAIPSWASRPLRAGSEQDHASPPGASPTRQNIYGHRHQPIIATSMQ